MPLQPPSPLPDDGLPPSAESQANPACVMVFNASDPSGAGGLTADITTVASVGGHPVAVVTGAYIRDTAEVFDHFSMDDEAVTDQARAALEDLPVQVIKVGFVGGPENISAIAELTADYPDLPVVSYMPNLSWWQDDLIDQYLDAFSRVAVAANLGVGWKPQHLVALAPSRLEQRQKSGPARHRCGSRRDGRALHTGDRHSPARAVH